MWFSAPYIHVKAYTANLIVIIGFHVFCTCEIRNASRQSFSKASKLLLLPIDRHFLELPTICMFVIYLKGKHMYKDWKRETYKWERETARSPKYMLAHSPKLATARTGAGSSQKSGASPCSPRWATGSCVLQDALLPSRLQVSRG